MSGIVKIWKKIFTKKKKEEGLKRRSRRSHSVEPAEIARGKEAKNQTKQEPSPPENGEIKRSFRRTRSSENIKGNIPLS
jgi:hypothetical protein